MSEPEAHNLYDQDGSADSRWDGLCSDVACLLEVLQHCVPARAAGSGSNSAFPHILRTRTSDSTPDKPLNRFIQGIADICAHDVACDIFATAMTAPHHLPRRPAPAVPRRSRVSLLSETRLFPVRFPPTWQVQQAHTARVTPSGCISLPTKDSEPSLQVMALGCAHT